MTEPLNDIEIRLKFQKLEDTLERQDDTLKRIESTGQDTNVKAGVTNGKVADIVKWQQKAIGATWAFGLCFTLIILPLLGYALYTQAQEPHMIHQAISNYFENSYSSVKINNGQ